MNEYKTKKLAEFDKRYDHLNPIHDDGKIIPTWNGEDYNDIKQFISDLIDEMERNLFLKDIVTKTRIDTLRQVLPTEENDREYDCGYICHERIVDKAKELWGIELNNLNK